MFLWRPVPPVQKAAVASLLSAPRQDANRRRLRRTVVFTDAAAGTEVGRQTDAHLHRPQRALDGTAIQAHRALCHRETAKH